MTDAPGALSRGDLSFLADEDLAAYLTGQRWFASKAREVTHIGGLAALPLWADSPQLVAGLVEARFQAGTHEVYQLLLGMRPQEEGWDEGVIAEAEGFTVYDALADPLHGHRLLGLLLAEAEVETEVGAATFHWVEGYPRPVDGPAEVRAIGAEQSNSSVVFGDTLVLKAYRRLEAGINPELELLRFLSDRGFRSIPALAGWYEYAGRLMDATLGVLQEYLPSGRDGWELALDGLAAGDESLLDRLRELGGVTGELHSTLASEPLDPAFAPEEPSVESLALLTATIDEEIDRIFRGIDGDGPAGEIAGRGEEVREQLRLLTHLGAAGKSIRTHGDYHLGQTLLTDDGWVLIDFEGEPARSLPERRRKRSPLRDVAGMLRSFAYAASASRILRGVTPPEGWEQRAREEFLEGYLETVDPALMPPGHEGLERLLSVFELEKAVYELRYELNNRPDWVGIPVAGILRLLEVPAQ